MGRGKSQRSLDLIGAAHTILAEIQPATVRAVCYRLFTMGLIDCMAKNHTNRVGTQLTWAREHGKIPWAWIVDETREAEHYREGWENPDAFLRAASRSYRRDFWAYQPLHIEIWSEKGTVRGTLAPVLEGYGVTFRVMHGYGSATAVHQVAELSRKDHKPWCVYYVGDWDPSGLHMSEVDLPKRLARYGDGAEQWASELGMTVEEIRRCIALAAVREEVIEQLTSRRLPTDRAVARFGERQVEPNAPGMSPLVRVALTAEDVASGGLPAFDAETKRGDPRWRWYVTHHGQLCWELDAMSPVLLRERVEQAIISQIDAAAWERCQRAETAEQQSLAKVLAAAGKTISRQASKYGATP